MQEFHRNMELDLKGNPASLRRHSAFQEHPAYWLGEPLFPGHFIYPSIPLRHSFRPNNWTLATATISLGADSEMIPRKVLKYRR